MMNLFSSSSNLRFQFNAVSFCSISCKLDYYHQTVIARGMGTSKLVAFPSYPGIQSPDRYTG